MRISPYPQKELSDEAKMEIIRNTRVAFDDTLHETLLSKKDKDLAKETERMFSDNVDDVAFEKALDMYQAYPALRYSISSYVELIKEDIIGQDEAIKSLVFAAYYNQFLNFYEEYMEVFPGKRKTLLFIAPTGNGKTAMMRSFEAAFNVPVHLANITATTSSGYVGENVEEMLVALYEKADCDLERAERGVLFIDEIDKKAAAQMEDKDVAGKAVQQELLKILEPGTVNITVGKKVVGGAVLGDKIHFDTSNLTIVLGGAFVGLDAIRNLRLNKNPMGFTAKKVENQEESYTHEDLINYGFIPEFVGRIDTIVEFRRLTAEDIVSIIFSPNSSMQQTLRILTAIGVKHVEIDSLLWEKIAHRVEKSSMGVRALNSLVAEMFYPILYDAFHHTDEGALFIDENGYYHLIYSNQTYEGCGIKTKFEDEEKSA